MIKEKRIPPKAWLWCWQCWACISNRVLFLASFIAHGVFYGIDCEKQDIAVSVRIR